MKFDMSIRINTRREASEVQAFAAEQFKKISSGYVDEKPEQILVKGIEASFGSINRSDSTLVRTKQMDGGCIVTADVNYRPSIVFWIFLVLGAFTYVGWLIPIVFYFYQKGSVKGAVESALKRTKDEFQGSMAVLQAPSQIEDLEKLAQLRDKGILTEDEFQIKKTQILGF